MGAGGGAWGDTRGIVSLVREAAVLLLSGRGDGGQRCVRAGDRNMLLVDDHGWLEVGPRDR